MQRNARQARPLKVLFVGEAATLAHIARPLVLAGMLDSERFALHFACDASVSWLLAGFRGTTHLLPSLGSAHFIQALARGKPLFDEATLERYVADDLKLLTLLAPDVVVGDFRLSLSVSARLAGVPYVAISNCYWSPYWRVPHYPPPVLPMTGFVPLPLVDLLLSLVRPIMFAIHSVPMNRVRRRHGLPSLGADLRRVYTDADHVVYADQPELFPGTVFPANHEFIGPLLWSPPVAAPDWWDSLRGERPLVYVTLGSSGQAELLPRILLCLANLDVNVVASTAGAPLPSEIPANARLAAYLPGEEAARRAQLVIFNGGSLTAQQALAAGVPVVAIASNLDQFLNMGALERAGVGLTLRADRFRAGDLASAVRILLAPGPHREAAQRLARQSAAFTAAVDFGAILTRIVER